MEFDEFRLAATVADIEREPAARDDADLLEFRMDLAADPLAALDAYDGALPVLATNRAAWEGGEAEGADRLDDLAAAAEHDDVIAIDVELNAVRHGDGGGVIDHAHEHGAEAVVSTHDFSGTPPADDLRDRLSGAADAGDLAKVAVTASDPADVLTVLMLTREFTAAGERVATMAMGGVGRHSRAIAPIYGSKLGYAPIDPAEATAPGQYDLATLRDLVEQLW